MLNWTEYDPSRKTSVWATFIAIIAKVSIEDPLIGEVLDGKYRLLGALGAGGMGKVYRAEQLALHREVAVKVLDASDSHRDADPAVERRFFLEASLCAKLSHPNVVTVHDYGRVELKGVPRFFIAMELLEGDTLHRRLGKGAVVMSAVDDFVDTQANIEYRLTGIHTATTEAAQ